MSTLGERVERARKESGKSQSELARQVGISPQAIQSIEAGNVRMTRYLLDIAEILDVRVQWLRRGDGPMREPGLGLAEDDVAFDAGPGFGPARSRPRPSTGGGNAATSDCGLQFSLLTIYK